MQVRMTADMLQVLRETPEMPDELLAAVVAAKDHGDGFAVSVNDDQAMAMVEMCQWYIKTDPATGEFTPKAKLFDSIVDAIDDAQLA